MSNVRDIFEKLGLRDLSMSVQSPSFLHKPDLIVKVEQHWHVRLRRR